MKIFSHNILKKTQFPVQFQQSEKYYQEEEGHRL